MTTLREAAQQALDYWEQASWGDAVMVDKMDALRAALAEPVQEPLGYLWPTGRPPEFRYTQQKIDGVDGTPVYTDPPQRKPLTEEEIDKATAQERDALLDHIYEYGTEAEGVLERIRKLCRAAIKAVEGEKT